MIAVYFPIFLDLKERDCLVVGGGRVAAWRTSALLRAGAEVEVVACEFIPELLEMRGEECLCLKERGYRPEDCRQRFLIVAATDDRGLNGEIGEEARKHGALVTVTDDPENCDFINPAVVRRGDLQIAISTGGKSPALAKRLKKELAGSLSEDLAERLEIVGELREMIKQEVNSPRKRREILERIARLVVD